jgi:imidazolonepropionase-like amidohydrolase
MKRHNTILWILLLSTLLFAMITKTSVAGALHQQRPDSRIYAVKGVAVVDVEKGEVLSEQTVIIAGDRIDKITPAPKSNVPDDAYIIEGKGLYMIPGLVDAHVHYFDPSTFGLMMVSHGVLLVRDMGSMNLQILPLREKLNKGDILGPEMVTTGAILDGDPPIIPQISIACKTPEDGREAVRTQAKAGVDQIKVYSGLEKDVYFAIVDEAKRQGLKPVGHVPESVYIEDAAEAGHRSCEHQFGFENVIGKLLGETIQFERGGMAKNAAYFMRLDETNKKELQKVLHKIRDKGMAVCPTIIVFKNGARLKDIFAGTYPMLEYISPMIKGIWKMMWSSSQDNAEASEKMWPHMLKFVAELHNAGLTLMVGTDLLFPGVIPGYSVHEEMALWQNTGIPQADILRSATIVPVQFFGLDNRLGTVAEGKTASVVLIDGDPLQDIRNVQKIRGVFLRGQYFSRSDLNQLLQKAKELCKNQ